VWGNGHVGRTLLSDAFDLAFDLALGLVFDLALDF
jgi:hypothetical protein